MADGGVRLRVANMVNPKMRNVLVAAVLGIVLLAVLYPLTYSSAYQKFSDTTATILSQAAAVAATTVTTTKTAAADQTLVLFAYSESETSRQNLEFFLAKGLHGNANFVFIFNGETNATDLVPSLPNVSVVERNNTCYDLGAYGEVLLHNELWKKYKRFVLMNASVRGPFFPNYMKPCWTDVFLDRINERVKLVGTTINCEPKPHLQSMVLATDHVGMAILLDRELATSLHMADKWGTEDDPVGLTSCFPDRRKAVHSEIGTTQLMLSQGYGVDVMLTAFSVDDEDLAGYCAQRGKHYQDPLVDGRYFGTSIHPYEMVFMKTNRDVAHRTMEIMTEWHMQRSWTSWDACR